jgi:hypothetical protein
LGLRYEGEGEYPALRAEGVRYEKGELWVERLLVNGQGYGLTGTLQASLGEDRFTLMGAVVGEGILGEGKSRYELRLTYGAERGSLRLGVDRYSLEGLGIKG